MANIKIRSFTGGGLKPYVPSIAKLRQAVFHECPLLYARSIDDETRYLKRIPQHKDAIAVIVFDGSKIAGASTGLPLEDETAEVQKPFVQAGLNISDYYHFGESILQKEYRGRGIGHHLFDHREAHVKHLKRFKYISFSTVIQPRNPVGIPKEYLPLDNFWKKRGYTQHPELKRTVPWQETGKKELVFWIKEL